MCWFGTQKVKLHANEAPTFLLLCAITNEKTVKFMQIDRLLSTSKTSPSERRSNNSGRYTLLKSHIPWSGVREEEQKPIKNSLDDQAQRAQHLKDVIFK